MLYIRCSHQRLSMYFDAVLQLGPVMSNLFNKINLIDVFMLFNKQQFIHSNTEILVNMFMSWL